VSPLRFFAAFAAAVLVGAATIVGVNGLIDPLGVVPASPSLRGVNAEKVMRFGNDRIYKPLDLLSARPRTVVLGTSRILQAFDPGTLSGTPYGPAYNYGLAGGDLDELETHFEKFIAQTPSVKYVFVELFLPRVVARSERPAPSTPELLAATLFSWSALQQSGETVWQNVRARSGRAALGPVVLADGRQSFVELSTLPNFLAYPSALLRAQPRYELNPSILESMRRMRHVAHRREIALTFFISPMHAVQLYGLYLTGHWPVLEKWKHELSREFNVLDFSAYSPVTEEPARGEMRYWVDPHHFSRHTASMLGERLVGRPGAADGFGGPLALDRLEDELRAWREARDGWITRNPEWVELYRLGRDEAGAQSPVMEGMPGSEQCPVHVAGAVLSRLTPPRPSRLWVVTSYRTTLDPPTAIRVRSMRLQDRDVDEACELTIDAAPETPSVRSVDWRMGHPMGAPAALRGRTVLYTVRVRASAPMTLSAAEIYVYDGARTSGAPARVLTREWRTITVAHTVSPDASRLEVWFRIVLGQGIVRPLGERVYFKATVDLLDDPH
jgi:hypothetical protein